jgi:hypothetical protein
MRIFGISLMTILIVLAAFYVGRKTTLLSFLPVIG